MDSRDEEDSFECIEGIADIRQQVLIKLRVLDIGLTELHYK
jgi:hypothetical protein